MEKYKRKAVFTELDEFEPFAKNGEFMEVTEWRNGEGFDVNIYNRANVMKFELTFGEFDALKKLVKRLEK